MRVSEAVKRAEKAFRHDGNKRINVSGTLEIGEDGFLELCLFDEKGVQAVHSHRYAGGRWDFWLWPGKEDRKRLNMNEKVRK